MPDRLYLKVIIRFDLKLNIPINIFSQSYKTISYINQMDVKTLDTKFNLNHT